MHDRQLYSDHGCLGNTKQREKRQSTCMYMYIHFLRPIQVKKVCKLHYQPLFGEGAHAFPENSLFLRMDLDQTQEHGENRFPLVNGRFHFLTVTLSNFLAINVLFPTKLTINVLFPTKLKKKKS